MRSCTLANWNLAWKRPQSAAGQAMTALLQPAETDLLCLTETSLDFLAHTHHPLLSEADYGYPQDETRRKVTLWSKTPWRDTCVHLEGAPSGRFAAGTTRTAMGDLRVIGLCVPWERAHVTTGRKDRAPWEEHIHFLRALLTHSDITTPRLPTVIMGDMNQTLPPRRARAEARAGLEALVARFPRAARANPARRIVCHVLASPDIGSNALSELPAHDGTRRLSDHHGERLRLTTL